MIYNKRSAVPPAFSKTSVFQKIKSELRSFYRQPVSHRRQQRPPHIPLPLSVLQKIRGTLIKQFKGKCAYCETPISETNHGDFDHFRPKSSARGLNDEFSLDHYWTLAYDWRNMYLCCEICNRYKVNWFPVEGTRASLDLTYPQLIKKEKPLLVDPCNDDPRLHLEYDDKGRAKGLSSKGKVTIDILKLNRKDLLDGRRNANKPLLVALESLKRKAGRFSAPNRKGNFDPSPADTALIHVINDRVADLVNPVPSAPYSGIQLYFLLKYLGDPSLYQYLLHYGNKPLLLDFVKKYGLTVNISASLSSRATAKERLTTAGKSAAISKGAAAISNRVIIESIVIENFRSIQYLHIPFPSSFDSKREPWLVLLGENGVGKSSILQAVTLALVGQEYLNKLELDPSKFLRYGQTSGAVTINRSGQSPIKLEITKSSFRSTIKLPQGFVLGYGVIRIFATAYVWTERNKVTERTIGAERIRGMARARNLFYPDSALYGDYFLLRLYHSNRKQFDFAARALKSLLQVELNDPGLEFAVMRNKVYLKYSIDGKKPDLFDDLSDGYKTIIALACDMMQALMQKSATMEIMEGIIILDEIGTHLHPRWKMRVVNSFREAFPRLQFIVTTHDPLCLKGLRKGEVNVLVKNEQGQVCRIDNLPDPGELRAEQLLASRFFGLSSTIDPEIENEFNEYYRLLSKGKLTKKEEARLKKLKDILKDKKHLGNSLREELALTAADQLLAREEQQPSNKSLSELEEDTIDLLNQWWDKPLEEKEKILA